MLEDSLNHSMSDSENLDTHRVATDRKLIDEETPKLPDDGPQDLVRKKTFVLTNKEIGQESFHGVCSETQVDNVEIFRRKTTLFGIKDEIDALFQEENPEYNLQMQDDIDGLKNEEIDKKTKCIKI